MITRLSISTAANRVVMLQLVQVSRICWVHRFEGTGVVLTTVVGFNNAPSVVSRSMKRKKKKPSGTLLGTVHCDDAELLLRATC